jgi:hypothetical protein
MACAGRNRMVKEKRSKNELETTILACCIARDLDVQRVVVWPTKALGWYAGFAAVPQLLVPYRARFERIVAEWQEVFDLAEQ